MEWMHIVIITLVKLLLSNSEHILNSKFKDTTRFRCITEKGHNFTERIRMYLYLEKLEIICNLYHVDNIEGGVMNILSPLYTSLGLTPSLEIFNRTSLIAFKFERSLVWNKAAWHLTIPRERIIIPTDIFPADEWYVRFKLHYGTRLFSTEGTLLDVVREPLLQWELGVQVEVAEIFPILQLAHTLIIVRRLCASDMAIIAPVFTSHELPNAGVYLLVTKSAFKAENDKWYDVKPKLCALLNGACDNIALKNIVLTNRHVLLLTTHGLFISHNLLDVGKNPKPGRQIEYYRSKLLPLKQQTLSKFHDDHVHLWFTHHCFTENTDNPEDFLSVTISAFTFANQLRKINTCFYATSPFKEWNICSPPHIEYISDIIATLWDQQRNTLITLSYLSLSNEPQTKVTLRKFDEDFTLRKMKRFPEFYFPDVQFIPSGMFMYPSTYTLYVFGSQVWYSNDGGISFELLLKLKNDFVEKIITCPRNHAVIFMTMLQNFYYTRPGLARYASLNIFKEGLSTLHCDHLGMLMKVTLSENSRTGLQVEFLNLNNLISEDNAGFSRPLALQFLTSTKAMFFEHISWIEHEVGAKPMFSNYHVGKLLTLSAGGVAEITEVYQKHSTSHFLAVAVVKIELPFVAEPFRRRLFSNKLLIVRRENVYHLELLDVDYGFEADDFEKTLVVPGYSSFLIVRVNSSNLVLAYATMPLLTIYYVLIEEENWFLYDFSSRNGTWRIYENECYTWIEAANNVHLNPFVLLDLNDTVNFEFKFSTRKAGSQVFKITVGNPHLIQISSKSRWDETGLSILNLVVTSNFNLRGYTTILVTIPEASLLCPITCLAIIVQCSCPARKAIVYLSHKYVSEHEWLHGLSENSTIEFNFLKELPVNYRPPSTFGINLPVSENIYNADPSKPKYRNFYELSKKTGRYKQCAMKKTREECGCTDEMRLSSFVQYSDCRQRVFQISYPVTDFFVHLYLKKPDNNFETLCAPYFIFITELNNRTNWKAKSTKITPSFDKLRKYFEFSINVHNPDGLIICLFGSELYHFRVEVIPGVSFCNLVEEFQIYVADPPMAYPFHYLVSMITAIGLGAFIMFYFILQHYWSNFAIRSPCWKFKIGPLPGKKVLKSKK